MFYPPSPTRPTRDAATSIGDGSVGVQVGDDLGQAADGDDDEAIANDEARPTQMLPQLIAQIKQEVDRFPFVRRSPTLKIYKHGNDGYTPEEFAARYPPGMFVIRNSESINKSANPGVQISSKVVFGYRLLLYFESRAVGWAESELGLGQWAMGWAVGCGLRAVGCGLAPPPCRPPSLLAISLLASLFEGRLLRRH